MEPSVDIGRVRLFVWNEWREWWNPKEWNWMDFHILWVHIENGAYKESVELNLGLMGLCVSVDWYYGKYEASNDSQ